MSTHVKQVVEVPSAPPAFAGAPYSQLIRFGDLLFSAGQVAEDPQTGGLLGDTIAAQTEQVMSNLGTLLEGAGSGLDKILHATIYLADLADWAEMNEVYGRSFTGVPPARATVQVGLPTGVLIEIGVIAYV